MSNLWLIHLSIMLAATVATAITTPLCRSLSWRWGFVDKPLGQAHKKHDDATPLLGGAAMIIGWLATVYSGLLAARLLLPALPDELRTMLVEANTREVWSLLAVISLGAVFLGIVGVVDDRRPMGPLIKLACQLVLCGIVALFPKLQITLFWQGGVMKWLITLGWFIFVVNAFNFFDNMDGLAAGVAFIASLLFAVVGALRGQVFVTALGACTAGTALGFLLYNRNPASIFMGDAGSHFLGYLLAAQGALTKFYMDEASPTVAPVFIPVFILALPIFDTFAVIVIRLRQGRPIYSGDHNHISHRFLRLGVSRRTAVFLVHLLALALGLGGVAMLWLPLNGVVLIFVQAGAILTLVSILQCTNGEEEPPGD